MQYGNLMDLITFIEYGTKLKLGVLFFGNYGNEYLQVPFERTIHSSAVCIKSKSLPNGYRKCYKCRKLAIYKALKYKKAFGGLCINGVYEYIRPVLINNDVACVIFIGNILPEGERSERIKKIIADEADLFETMETNFGFEKCDVVAQIIEGYIKMVIELFPLEDAGDKYSQVIQNLKTYIEENLECKIDLSVLAGVFHYNQKYLGRLFKQKTGQSFCEYINHRRLVRAKVLLKETNESVITISEKLGFNNVTYFNRLFKRYYNVSPTVYRQNHNR